MFSIELLQAVNDWQRGGDEKAKAVRGKRLYDLAAKLPQLFKVCNINCYRRLSLSKGSVWIVGTEYELKETISSWTVSLQVAQKIKNGVPSKNYLGVIFEHRPKPKEIVVNLDSLYSNPDFLKAIDLKKRSIKNFNKGIGKYWNTQREVVISLTRLPLDAVHCWGGYIGDENSFQGMLPDGQSMADFKALLAKSPYEFNQPRWLCNQEAIMRVNTVLVKNGQRLAAYRAAGLCS